jgi:repressor LexA
MYHGKDAAGPGRRRSDRPLTPKQAALLRRIAELTRTHGWPPTLRELADDRGVHYTSIRDALVLLERRGYVAREYGTARGLTLLKPPPEPPRV